MNVERLVPSHASEYRALMLEAYAAHPEAFTSSFSERLALPLSWWEARLAADETPKEMVLGAFEGSVLAGIAGLSFDQREKVRHKATLFGMYVSAKSRRRGMGRALVVAALEYARSQVGVRIVQLTVTHGNLAALRLYESCGFVQFGLEPFAVAVGDGYVSKVHMWRNVEASDSEKRT